MICPLSPFHRARQCGDKSRLRALHTTTTTTSTTAVHDQQTNRLWINNKLNRLFIARSPSSRYSRGMCLLMCICFAKSTAFYKSLSYRARCLNIFSQQKRTCITTHLLTFHLGRGETTFNYSKPRTTYKRLVSGVKNALHKSHQSSTIPRLEITNPKAKM